MQQADLMEKFEALGKSLECRTNCAEIDVSRIVFDAGLRKSCEMNSCGAYGRNYMCPPFCGEIHELIDISATMLPPMFVAFIAEMFLGDGSLKLLPVHCVVLLCYGIFVYAFLIRDFTRKAKVYYLACYVGAFYLSRVLL